MIASTQIRKPENWQDFEKLCKKLWGQIWNCPQSIRRNGRSGQKQNGVDIYGKPDGESEYWGIQCKGKDENLGSNLTFKEIDDEIKNALGFKPPLKRLIFATSANKDVKVEEYIREKDIEHAKIGLFSIELACWGDIVDFLEEYKETYDWYINNCQYKDSSDIEISFNGDNKFIIKPQYIKTIRSFFIKPKDQFNSIYSHFLAQNMQSKLLTPISFPDYLNPKRKIDYRWCTVPIKVKNIGSTVIEDYKVILEIEGAKIEEISDKFKYFNPGPIFDKSAVIIENKKREENQEVFESTEYLNVIEFRPLKKILVQGDYEQFKIGIKPKDNIDKISVTWIVLSRDYTKKDVLTLKVVPDIEERSLSIESDTPRKTEIEITPKIIEE